MFKKLGGLTNYWHVIAFSTELGKGKSKKRMFYGFPILIWRDTHGNISAVADVCSHKRSTLEVADFQKNEIVCPYHGWKYHQNGSLLEIPSSPHLPIDKLKCKLKTYPIIEQDGFVWIYLQSENQSANLPISLEKLKNWGQLNLQYVFETNEELLIENFMDATHTAFIHKGLIRGFAEPIKHQLCVKSNENGVLVEFAETEEKVALGLNYLLGNKLKIRHTDAFLFPNIVKVDYYINEIHRFNAFIACTPLEEGKTKAFVCLSFNFKVLNPIIKLILPYLAKKVILQDYEITKMQYQNQQLFSEQADQCIDADLIHNKVVMLRKSIINHVPINSSETSIEMYL